MSAPTEQEFLRDVAQHEMQVLMDNGVYRHIRFKQPGTVCMHFDFITYPGHLVYSGDMGCYVFSRLYDMFEFFRTDRKYAERSGRQLAINLSYWSEKLEAVDGNRRSGAAKEYSPEKFERAVKEQLVTWWRESNLTREQRRELRQEVEYEVLDKSHDGDVRAYDAAHGFHHTIGSHKFMFRDWWDHDFTDYTHRFKWCCYALAWGIKQYDDAKAAAQTTPPAEQAA